MNVLCAAVETSLGGSDLLRGNYKNNDKNSVLAFFVAPDKPVKPAGGVRRGRVCTTY